MQHMQNVTNNNHVKFDIHMLDNMEDTRTFMFNLHIQTGWITHFHYKRDVTRCYENRWIRYFDQISARPNRAP